jgi:hypothetical protein
VVQRIVEREGQGIHPRVERMQREDPECLRVLAAICRAAAGESNSLVHLDDAELASHVLMLQDAGLLTLSVDRRGHFYIDVSDPSTSHNRLPTRRERRQRQKRKR